MSVKPNLVFPLPFNLPAAHRKATKRRAVLRNMIGRRGLEMRLCVCVCVRGMSEGVAVSISCELLEVSGGVSRTASAPD